MRGLRLGTLVIGAMVAMAFTASCGGERGDAGWAGSTSRAGDTVVVMTANPPDGPWPPVLRADTPVVFIPDSLLVRVVAIARLGGSDLAVADGGRIMVFGPDGSFRRLLARSGRGPGELMEIRGLASVGTDTVVAWDASPARLVWYASTGQYLRTQPTSGVGAFRSPGRGMQLRQHAGRVRLLWTMGLIRPNGPPDSAAIVEVAVGDSASGRVLGYLESTSWVSAGPAFGPKSPFGPQPLLATSPDGRAAMADGVAYCVLELDASVTPRRFCRQWEPAPIGQADRVPAALATDSTIDPDLRVLITAQQFQGRRNAFDMMLFDEAGRLWVRVMDGQRLYHPYYEARHPDLRPAAYTWEVFDRDGRLAARVALASRFRPLLIDAREAIGLLDGPGGEQSIARVAVPAL